MNFFDIYNQTNFKEIQNIISDCTTQTIEAIIKKETLSFNDFLCLLSPSAEKHLKSMASRAQKLTRKHFGKTINFYVPLYLSNECDNSCTYCGFHKNADISRKTLTLSEIEEELIFLKTLGFQNILLLTGESPKAVDVDYISKAVKIARKYFAYVSLEIFPLSEENYKKLVEAGASGLTIYQETYHQKTYGDVHPKGPKKNFIQRISTPDHALKAGFRKLGIGSLLGLYDWRFEAASIGLHASYLIKNYWRGEITISFPRLRDMNRNFKTTYPVKDKNLVQMILALRLFLPWVGLILSTRESPDLRDNLLDFGITQISAESKTTPGGYKNNTDSGEQFSIADSRPLSTLKKILEKKGLDPVLKDWCCDFQGIERKL